MWSLLLARLHALYIWRNHNHWKQVPLCRRSDDLPAGGLRRNACLLAIVNTSKGLDATSTKVTKLGTVNSSKMS